MLQESILEKKPMPLPEFLSALTKLVKAGKWKIFKEAVQKRKKYFEDNPNEGIF